jgi:predicted DNA-binding transcriptional regulator AlpA
MQSRIPPRKAKLSAAFGRIPQSTDSNLTERAAAALKTDGLMTPPETAAIYRVSLSTLWAHARQGLMPSPIRLGNRCTRWRASDVRAHLQLLAEGTQG